MKKNICKKNHVDDLAVWKINGPYIFKDKGLFIYAPSIVKMFENVGLEELAKMFAMSVMRNAEREELAEIENRKEEAK